MKNIKEEIKKLGIGAMESIERIKEETQIKTQKLNELEDKLFNISHNAKKLGLDVRDVTYSFTDNFKLSVSLQLTSISEKFKFIKFAGYNSSGRGLNHKRLYEKSIKIEEKLRIGVGNKINVNPYSLEYEDDNKSKRVLVTFIY